MLYTDTKSALGRFCFVAKAALETLDLSQHLKTEGLLLTLAYATDEVVDLGPTHRRTVLAHHLGEIFGKRINLLLQEEERGANCTQLSLVNDKGDGTHLVLMSKVIFAQPIAR